MKWGSEESAHAYVDINKGPRRIASYVRLMQRTTVNYRCYVIVCENPIDQRTVEDAAHHCRVFPIHYIEPYDLVPIASQPWRQEPAEPA
ncbi:hypothetical protein Enr13x_20950 [Stieleria neptunia]|uniref:Uncharacterized protein n=1 Tax=Stieleria neptunia TaxID=2527979 RepID=A0A518HN66_9BACT|nr:hypothetical protein Enr13x_20950 [Stieleria neptunia]